MSVADRAELEAYVQMTVKFLHHYKWLADAFILDFFTEHHWSKLSDSWQRALADVEPQFLSLWLSGSACVSYSEVWPLSLQAFRVTATTLSLPRKAVNSTQPVLDHLHHSLGTKPTSADNIHWKSPSDEQTSDASQHHGLKHVFRRHVKPKKQHEIMRMSQVADIVMQRLNCKHVVDVGSGQGHLSRLLAFGYKFHVTALESEGCHVSGAKKFDAQVVDDMRKVNGSRMLGTNLPHSNCEPQHHQCVITGQSCKDDIVHALAANGVDDNCLVTHQPNTLESFALLGLHTCGNLAATMLKLYTEIPEALAILSVSCCYMKLDSSSSDAVFPMSQYLKSLPHHEISYEGKEVACHAIEMYQQRLKTRYSSLKIHCYRAVLETLIMRHYPLLKRIGLRSVKHSDRMSFPEYATKALSHQKLFIPANELSASDVEYCLQEWKKVIVFYSLRLMLAPVIESLILVDRVLYLLEKGFTTSLIPLFDPLLSPRNILLLSVKRSHMPSQT